MTSEQSETEVLLHRINSGEDRAFNELIDHLYDEMKRLAAELLRNEANGSQLETTALVNEACVRLLGPDGRNRDIVSRRHFFSGLHQAVLRILVDHSRKRNAAKRGGNWVRHPFDSAVEVFEPRYDVRIADLKESLENLRQNWPRQAEAISLRFLCGFKVHEVAELLDVTERTCQSDLSFARAWLHNDLRQG